MTAGARDIHRMVDDRLDLRLPDPPLSRVVGEVDSVVAGLGVVMARLGGAARPVPVAYPALPVALLPGDRVAVERRRDGWLMVTHVLARDGWAEVGAAIDAARGSVPDVAALPAAAAALAGRMYRVPGGVGVADVVSLCKKDAADAWVWVVVA